MADNLQFKIEVLGLTEDLREIGRLKTELENLGKVKKNLNKAVEDGTITVDKYYKQMGLLDMQTKATKANLKILTDSTYAQSTAFKGAEGSMIRMNEELGKLRTQYRNLSEAERENIKIGGVKLQQINDLDTKIKGLDARIGNHQRNIGNYGSAMKGLLGSLIPFGGAVGLATVAIQGLGRMMMDGAKGALEDERANRRLLFALNGNIEAYERISAMKDKLIDKSTFTEDEIRGAQTFALELGRTEGQATKMIETAMGMATVMGTDLDGSMQMLSNTLEGNVGRLGKFDSRLKDLTKTQLANGDAIDLLREKFQKYASEGINTADGRITMIRRNVSEFTEDLMKTATVGVYGLIVALQKLYQYTLKPYIDLLLPKDVSVRPSYMQDFGKQQFDLFNASDKSGQDKIIKANEDRAKSFQKLWQAATDPAKRAQYSVMYDEQLELAEKLKQAQEKGGSKFVDKDAINKAIEAEKKAAEKRTEIIKGNNYYLFGLSQNLLTAKVNAIANQQTREIESEKAKYQIERNELLNKQAEELKLIDEQIKIIEGKKGKATAKELADLKTLQENRVALIDATASMVEAKENEHQRAIADIKKKYDPRAKDDEIGKKYGEDVTSANTEYQVKLDALRAFYVQKGQLSDEDRKKQFQDETKLAIDLYTKEYQLLMAQIEARKKLGTITIEDYNAALKAAGELYLKIQTLGGNADAAKKDTGGTGGGWGKKATSFIAGLFSIKDNEAQQIISQVEQLAQNILNLWADMQNRKVDAELKRTNSRLKKEEDAELKSLEQRRRAGLITEGAFNREKENLDKKYNQKRQDAERKAFEQKKKNEQTMIWINAAVASISAFKESWIVGLIMTALIMAQAGIQSAFVGSQKYEGYARGGMIRGKRHSEGGEKYAVGGQVKELEDGEGVLNRNIMASSQTFSAIGTPREIASSLNSMYGWGVPFSGGYTPVSTPATKGAAVISGESLSAIDSMITQRINTLRVVVVESDITEKQNAVKKVQTLASW